MTGQLTILGASVRAAAFSAARAGFAPYAIDTFADQDLELLCPAERIDNYPRGFLRALSDAPQAPWMYAGGLENHPRLVERLAALRPLWGNPASVLRAVRDPRQLRQALTAAGLAYPAEATDWRVGSVIIKPRRSGGGLGVRLLVTDDPRGISRGYIAQRYIEGENGSAVYVAAGGRAVLLGATRQWIGRDWDLAAEFLYVGSCGPLDLSVGERDKLARLGNVLADQFRLVGLFNVDFVRTPGDIWTVEVNPRYSASVEVLEWAAGQAFVSFHAAAFQGGTLPPLAELTAAPSSARYFGKAIVYAHRDCRAGKEFHQFARAWNVGPWPLLADLPAEGQVIRAGHPVATVFAEEISMTAVAAELRRRAADVLANLPAVAAART